VLGTVLTATILGILIYHWRAPVEASRRGETATLWPFFWFSNTRLCVRGRSQPKGRVTMRMVTNRINIFVSLPMKSLDALTLQKQLDAIGKNQDRTPDTPEVAEWTRSPFLFYRENVSISASPLLSWPEKGGSMITVEAKRLGTRVIATVKVGISTGRYTYTVQFADQGSEAANEVEAQRELRRTLEEVLEALGPSWMNGSDDRRACAVSAPLQAAASIHSKIGWKGARTASAWRAASSSTICRTWQRSSGTSEIALWWERAPQDGRNWPDSQENEQRRQCAAFSGIGSLSVWRLHGTTVTLSASTGQPKIGW
jgi:hypothetical protein